MSLPAVDAHQRALKLFNTDFNNVQSLLRVGGGAGFPDLNNDQPEEGTTDGPVVCNPKRMDELWVDQDLLASYSIYLENFNLTVVGDCLEEPLNHFNCPVDQYVEGEMDYRNACTAVGGEIHSIPIDLRCNMADSEGVDYAVLYDNPPWLVCFPASEDFDGCEESTRNVLLQTYATDTIGLVEDDFVKYYGVTDVSCILGDASSTASRYMGFGFGFVAMIVLSLMVYY